MKEIKINIKQEQFCKYYLENNSNATQAYMKAFGTNYKTAKANASRLLTNDNIIQKIRMIMNQEGFNDIFVDLELKKMIIQDNNPSVKIRAIAEYNKLMKRYDESVNINVHAEPIRPDLSKMDARELDQIRQQVLNGKY